MDNLSSGYGSDRCPELPVEYFRHDKGLASERLSFGAVRKARLEQERE